MLEVQPFSRDLKPGQGGADRSKLPTPTSFPDAPFPAMSQATLPNGMRLIVAERHAVPVVQLSIDGTKPAQYHYDVGKRLAVLRDAGVQRFSTQMRRGE